MKPHEPKIIVDNEHEVCYVVCNECGAVLWYPKDDERCDVPPALGINVNDGMKMGDRMG